MTKFSVGASQKQAQAAVKACNNLKKDVNQLMNKVNSFGAENFEGAAADNAQQYAESVIMPLLRGASALFDDIPIAMKRLPGEYEGKVDHKSWSTEKLKAKIKQYETAAKKAQKAADAANKLAQKASGMGTVGAGIMAAASKCAAGFEKGMASAQKAIAKFKKILDDFDRFDVFSPTIFNEIATLESNLNKGQKVANGAYNPSSHQFSIPKESELDWAKELNGTYAEHEHEKKSIKSIGNFIWNPLGKIHSNKWGIKGLKDKNVKKGHFGWGINYGGKAHYGYKKGELDVGEEGAAATLYGKGPIFKFLNAKGKLSALRTKIESYESINPHDLGFEEEARGAILEGDGKANIGSGPFSMSTKVQYAEIGGSVKARENSSGFDFGFEGDIGLSNAELGSDNLNITHKAVGESEIGINGRLSVGLQAKIQAEVSSKKIGNLDKGTYEVYQNNLNIDGIDGVGADVNVAIPTIRRAKFSSNKTLATLEQTLQFMLEGVSR